jgi:hypothetical protein
MHEWERRLFGQTQPTRQTPTPTQQTTGEPNTPYVERALTNELHEISTAPDGTRNNTLNTATVKLAGLIAGGHLDLETTIHQIRGAAKTAGLGEHETEQTIHSALTYGLQHPRHPPQPTTTQPLTPFNPQTGEISQPNNETNTEPAGPQWVDLTWILTGTPPQPPQPTIGQRTDGTPILYPGKVNGLYGDPESGKTWIALHFGTQTLNNGQRFAIIDIDHNGASETAQRLTQLGAQPEHVANPDTFRYYEPETRQDLGNVLAELSTWNAQLIALDSIGELIPMLGLDSNSNDDITRAFRGICVPLANTGAAVLTIDHLGKGTEAKASGYAIGGSAKKRQINGTYLHAETINTPAPGQRGTVLLKISKDRNGQVRQHAPDGTLGTFTLDSTQPGTIHADITANPSTITATGKFRPTRQMEQISRLLERCPDGLQRTAIYNELGGDKINRPGVDALIEERYARTEPRGRNTVLVFSTRPFRERDEPANPFTF